MFKGKTVCFFDADLWAVRPYDLSEFEGQGGVYGVIDPCVRAPNTFVHWDKRVLGIEHYIKHWIFHCGFLVMQVFVYAFEVARKN